MDQRKATLLRSVLSLVAVVALGGGVTYALFTSNQVTVSQTQVTTGSADLKVCNSSASSPAGTNTWKESISPVIDFDGLNPNDSAIEISSGHVMYLGNDDGSLGDAVDSVLCNTYDGTATVGDSTVDMRMVPSVSAVSCTIPDDLQLRFDLGGTLSPYKTLTAWSLPNATDYAPTFLVGEAKQLKIEAKLDGDVTSQNETCTFDIHFSGEQA